MSFALKSGVAVIALALCATAIGVVATKHEARSLFIQLQGLNGERDALGPVEARAERLGYARARRADRARRSAHGDSAARRSADRETHDGQSMSTPMSTDRKWR
jgi:hypothetical protein